MVSARCASQSALVQSHHYRLRIEYLLICRGPTGWRHDLKKTSNRATKSFKTLRPLGLTGILKATIAIAENGIDKRRYGTAQVW
jgi:hypothetical protein